MLVKKDIGDSDDNNPTLVQVMAWCRTGDKPLLEPMMVNFFDSPTVNGSQQ